MAGHFYNGRELELLIPASSLEVLKTAVIFGADAVYIGGEAFGLRAKAKNFSMEDMKEGIAFAHAHDVKVYVTANILAHNYDLEGARAYFEELKTIGPDALIISDPGMFTIAKEVMPDTDIHISTQANNTNYMTYQFWWKQGAKRVVTARELSLNEIAEIRKNIPDEMEIETFVHGAMCISYSGRCLLSSYLTGRDGNRGACAQACRWEYSLIEKNRPDEGFDIEEDERGTYVMNSKDLCLIDHIPDLIEGGICSLKIEGRMKSIHYVATVVSVYRKAIDAYCNDPKKYQVTDEWRQELEKVSHRPYTKGFAFGKPGSDGQVYTTSSYEQTHDFVGIVLAYDADAKRAYIEQRNNVKNGEVLELLMPDGELFPLTLEDMRNADGESIDCAPHAQQKFSIVSDRALMPDSLLRRKVIC